MTVDDNFPAAAPLGYIEACLLVCPSDFVSAQTIGVLVCMMHLCRRVPENFLLSGTGSAFRLALDVFVCLLSFFQCEP